MNFVGTSPRIWPIELKVLSSAATVQVFVSVTVAV